MRRTNGQDKVITAFLQGKAADGPKCYNKNLSVFGERIIRTDGQVIYSYLMPIAFRGADGFVYLLDYKDGPSRTTKQQIDAIRYGVVPSGIPVHTLSLSEFNRLFLMDRGSRELKEAIL